MICEDSKVWRFGRGWNECMRVEVEEWRSNIVEVFLEAFSCGRGGSRRVEKLLPGGSRSWQGHTPPFSLSRIVNFRRFSGLCYLILRYTIISSPSVIRLFSSSLSIGVETVRNSHCLLSRASLVSWPSPWPRINLPVDRSQQRKRCTSQFLSAENLHGPIIWIGSFTIKLVYCPPMNLIILYTQTDLGRGGFILDSWRGFSRHSLRPLTNLHSKIPEPLLPYTNQRHIQARA
jgi:hypothetical protein